MVKEKEKYVLQVNPQLTFNLNTQIKEQIKWLIGIRQIEAGDMLPTASQLADALGLNRNTLNWVYNQLGDEGLVTIKKGRGTQINNGLETKRLIEERKLLQQIFDDTISKAISMGVDLQSFFITGLAYSMLQPPYPNGKLRILLVECSEHNHPFYRQQIEQVTNGEVETLFLDDKKLNDNSISEVVKRTDLIITTLNHSKETISLFNRFNCHVNVIGATIKSQLLLDIAKLQKGTRVAFVCLGKSGGEWMVQQVLDSGIDHLHLEGLGMDEPAHLNETLQRVDKIYASSSVLSELQRLYSNRTELFSMMLEKSSENLLLDIVSSTK
ncbi:HTH-type transcriptional repressor YtrA [compost metagenome]